MNCEETKQMLFSYIEGELSVFDKEKLEKHLNQCESCRAEYESYKIILNSVKELPMEELPEDYCDKLHTKLITSNKIDKRKRVTKYIGIAASFLIVMTCIFALTNKNNLSSNSKNFSALYDGNTDDNNSNYELSNNKTEVAEKKSDINIDNNIESTDDSGDNKENTITIAGNTSRSAELTEGNKKIIKSYNVHTQTLDYDKFVGSLMRVTSEKDGYFEYNRTSVRSMEDGEFKTGNIRIRVPSGCFDEVVSFIKKESKVSIETRNEDDATKTYYETENKVKNLQVQEERLRELYNKATNVTEILELENEIRRVRTEIDNYSIKLSDIDNLVEMSTIEIVVDEVKANELKVSGSSNVMINAKNGIVDTINTIVCGAQQIFVWFITNIPYILIISIVVVVFVLIYKKRSKKINKK